MSLEQCFSNWVMGYCDTFLCHHLIPGVSPGWLKCYFLVYNGICSLCKSNLGFYLKSKLNLINVCCHLKKVEEDCTEMHLAVVRGRVFKVDD